MYGVSLSIFVMLVMFVVLIVGTIKAVWSLINDDTGGSPAIERLKKPEHFQPER
jgi:hypothetical protein